MASDHTLTELFDDIRLSFPASLSSDWYLPVASALIACHRQACFADLYLYLISLSEFQTHESRKVLSRRLREVLMRMWTTVGVPLVVEALAAWAKVEKEEDSDDRFTRSGEQIDATTRARGEALISSLYTTNLGGMVNSRGFHSADFDWLLVSVVYGLFLSHPSLTPTENQLLALPAMMCMGLKGPVRWHLRGLRRLGASADDIEQMQVAVEKVATWAGVYTTGWIRVADVEHEV